MTFRLMFFNLTEGKAWRLRRFMKNILTAVRNCLCAVFSAALLAQAASGANWKFSSSVNYDTGKYGTGTRTSSVYIPFTLKRYYREGDISATLPLVRQSTTGQITSVGGRPMRVGGGGMGGGGVKTTSETGIGDILLRGSYILKTDGPKSYDLAAAGSLKLPTADKNRGLGTGEMDEGAGLEFGKEISSGLTLLADGYFTIIGDPSGVDFKNQLSLDIGVMRQLDKRLALTFLYETRSAIVDGSEDARELSGTLDYAAADGNRYSGGLLFGLSNGSPQFGLSAGFSRRF